MARYDLIGARIRALRESRNWTQGQLAYKAGTTAAQISRIENNERPGAAAVTVGAIALALDTTVEYFLGQTHDPGRPPAVPKGLEDELPLPIQARIREVVTRTSALPLEGQQRVLDALLLLLEVHETLSGNEKAVLPEHTPGDD